MPVKLIQITDTHIHDLPTTEFYQGRPDQSLQRIVRHAKHCAPDIDAVIVTGDLTHDGGAQACQHLQTLLADFDCPVYVTLGNHDVGTTIRQHLLNQQISQPTSVTIGHWQLLFADSHVDHQVSGWVDPARLDEINQHLLHSPQPAMLFTHHPPVNIQCQWLDRIGLDNGDVLVQQLLPFKQLKAIVFGHIHQAFSANIEHLQLLGTPSSCIQFKPNSKNFALDTRDPGYRIIELEDNGDWHSQVQRCPNQLKKIISGGQTGVDRAALDIAIELAIPHGGWCPQGRRAVDGVIDEKYQLMETESADYPVRTEWNVRDANGTLVLSWGQPDGGTALTIRIAERLQKPVLVINLLDPVDAESFWQWLQQHNIEILNIAGPRHSKAEALTSTAQSCLLKLLCHNA